MAAAEDVHEGPLGALPLRPVAVGADEPQQLIVRQHAALVGDVVADERHAVVAGEQQRALMLLEVADVRVVLDEGGQPGLPEQLPGQAGAGGQETADADRQRGLVAQDARVGGAVQGGDAPHRVGDAGPLGDQRAPLLAEHLARGDQLDVPLRPGQVLAVDDVLQERRITEQHDLVEVRGQLGQHPRDLPPVGARGDHGDRVTALGQVTAAPEGEQAADPGAEREADHGERPALQGLEGVPEHLLEPLGDDPLVARRARPERRRAGGAGRDGDHVPDHAVPAQVGQRVPQGVGVLRGHGQAGEVVQRGDLLRVHPLLGEEPAVGGHGARHLVEELNRVHWPTVRRDPLSMRRLHDYDRRERTSARKGTRQGSDELSRYNSTLGSSYE